MLSMNAQLMGCWHDEVAQQMASMSTKMEVGVRAGARARVCVCVCVCVLC
jgi:hypothetical protein